MDLTGCRVVFVAANEGLEESEVVSPVRALRQAGARVDLIAPRSRQICLLRRENDATTRQISIPASKNLDEIAPGAYDAVLLPRPLNVLDMEADVQKFLCAMEAAGKPVISLHGSAAADGSNPAPSRSGRRDVAWKRLLLDSFNNWNAIHASRLGAALAYYTVLSLAPLLVILVAIAGMVFDRQAVEGRIVQEMHAMLGAAGSEPIRAMLESARHTTTGVAAGVLGILTLLFGASGVFLELRDSLNTVWGVRPSYGSGIAALIRTRSFSFLLVLGTGFLMVVSLAISAAVSAAGKYLGNRLPAAEVLIHLVTLLVSFSIITLLFALIYMVIPDIEIAWSDVWIGATVTSLLFTCGKFLLGLYLGKISVGSAYGAAGSLVVMLVWVYYSAQIFLLGAEFTHVYARRHGTYANRDRPRRQH